VSRNGYCCKIAIALIDPCEGVFSANAWLQLGLLSAEKCYAAEILHERGLRISTIRESWRHNSQAGSIKWVSPQERTYG
jgi:hypothetical protein